MRRRAEAALTLLLAPLLGAGCGDAARGRDAYREGRFPEAHEAFARAADAEGDRASAELLFNRALAALRAGEVRDAEASAERAAARGDPRVAEVAGFLRGNAAFAAFEIAERQAGTAAAEPFAWDVAIAYAEKARRFWQDAAMSRGDWPEARRNVERANLRLEELRRRAGQAATLARW